MAVHAGGLTSLALHHTPRLHSPTQSKQYIAHISYAQRSLHLYQKDCHRHLRCSVILHYFSSPNPSLQRWPASPQCLSVPAQAARSLIGVRAVRKKRLRSTSTWKATPSGNKMPHPVHAILPWEKQVKGRTVIVGDVHGCYDELQELLAACGFQRDKDNLVLVGDIVNKGPKSREVVTFAHQVGAYVVRGNHDDGVVQAVVRDRAARGRNAWVKSLSPEEVQFLESLPFSLRLEGRGVVVVHAGMKPGRTLMSQKLRDLILLRECRPSGSHQGKVPWASIWTGPVHVFFGHDAKRGLQLHAAATGLDTGCCYGNSLTACILPALSSAASRYQPDRDCTSSSLLAQGGAEGKESADDTEAVFAQARRASQADRRALASAKKTLKVGNRQALKEIQQPRTALTLAQLQGKLVSVPARIVYCHQSGKQMAAQLSDAE